MVGLTNKKGAGSLEDIYLFIFYSLLLNLGLHLATFSFLSTMGKIFMVFSSLRTKISLSTPKNAKLQSLGLVEKRVVTTTTISTMLSDHSFSYLC